MTTLLPQLELFNPEATEHPGGALADGPIAAGSQGYAVLDFALATAVLRDTRFQNSALKLMEEFGIDDGPVHDFRAQSIIMAEGERNSCACAPRWPDSWAQRQCRTPGKRCATSSQQSPMISMPRSRWTSTPASVAVFPHWCIAILPEHRSRTPPRCRACPSERCPCSAGTPA